MSTFIYQQQEWPKFHWKNELIFPLLLSIRHKQGILRGRMEQLGFKLREEASLEVATENIIKSSEIEGEVLNPQQVRSSVARRLGMDIAGLIPSDRNTDGVVEMMLDATQHFNSLLNEGRIFGWHAALFPSGRSGMHKIDTGKWRVDQNGPMQVISGPFGKEIVHFEAPPAHTLVSEMQRFFDWFNSEIEIDPVLKACIAHFWFIIIHPFEDGNGRIARAIADMLLAKADNSPQRFYSMSAQIQRERNAYYDVLETAQKGTLDISAWMEWFLKCLNRALDASEILLAQVLIKANFWNKFALTPFNARQTLMLNKLLDGFEGKLNTSKWAKIAKCSQDTALRDIQDLVEKNVLVKEDAGGRSTSYVLVNN